METFDRQRAENNLYELIGAFDIEKMYQDWAEENGVTMPFGRIEDSPAYDDAIEGVLRRLVEAEEHWWQREADGARAKLEAEAEAVRAIYAAWDGTPETWGDAHRDLLRRLQEEEGWDEDILEDYIGIVIWQGWEGDWETYESAGGWGSEDGGDEANDLCDDLLRELDWAEIARGAAEVVLPDLISQASERAEDLLADRDDFGWDGLNLRAYGRRYGDFDSGWAGGFLVTLTDDLRLQVQWIDDQGEHEPEIVDFSVDALYAEFRKINVPDPRI